MKLDFIWKNKFIYWNFIALFIVKVVFSYSSFQFATLLNGPPVFSKEEIISQTNNFRSASGLTTLKENATLDAAASEKLADMIKNQYFAHFSPGGISPWHWIEVNKYDYSYAGENLAIGFTNASDTVNAWSASPAHRANLANPDYREIGVAVVTAKIQNSEGILVVQLFGTPRPITAAAKPIKPKVTPSPLTTPGISSRTIDTPGGKATVQTADAPKTFSAALATQGLTKLAETLNFALIFYSLLIFLAGIASIVFKEATKEVVAKTAVSFGLVVLAVAIPLIQATNAALIF